jgi:hypothetical protein
VYLPCNRRHWLFIKLVRFILFGSLKNYSNLSGFPLAFISTYQTEFHHRLWRLPYTEVLVYHKQRVEVFHSNLSLERSWVPFRCWVSLVLTRFTSIWVHAFILHICISNYANMMSSYLHRQTSESSIFITKLPLD